VIHAGAKIGIMKKCLISDYSYHYYFDTKLMKELIKNGYVTGRSVSYYNDNVRGFFSVTDLGKEWLKFNEL